MKPFCFSRFTVFREISSPNKRTPNLYCGNEFRYTEMLLKANALPIYYQLLEWNLLLLCDYRAKWGCADFHSIFTIDTPVTSLGISMEPNWSRQITRYLEVKMMSYFPEFSSKYTLEIRWKRTKIRLVGVFSNATSQSASPVCHFKWFRKKNTPDNLYSATDFVLM